jgi:hypothetical protein
MVRAHEIPDTSLHSYGTIAAGKVSQIRAVSAIHRARPFHDDRHFAYRGVSALVTGFVGCTLAIDFWQPATAVNKADSSASKTSIPARVPTLCRNGKTFGGVVPVIFTVLLLMASWYLLFIFAAARI